MTPDMSHTGPTSSTPDNCASPALVKLDVVIATVRRGGPSVSGVVRRAGQRYRSGSRRRSARINVLPDELLLQIFSYVTVEDLINLQKVCKRWKNLAQDDKLWCNKEYVIREDTPELSAVATLRAAPQLRALVMKKGVSRAVFSALAENCRKLTSLTTRLMQMQMDSMEVKKLFGSLKELRTLRSTDPSLLTNPLFSDAVAQLSQLQVLQLMPLRSDRLGIVELVALTDGCPNLQELYLGHLYYNTAEAQRFIDSKKHLLSRLCLRWTSTARWCIVPQLAQCADTLEHLHLNSYDVPAKEAEMAFTALGQLHNLRHLVLDSSFKHVADAAPLAFRNGGLSKLEWLGLWCIRNVGDETMAAVAEGCPRLAELSLATCGGLTDAALRSVSRLEHLQKVKISSCTWLGGEAIEHISKLPALRTLCLGGLTFSDLQPGVECFLDMSALCHLYLSDCACQSVPFCRFPGRLTNLRKLHIEACEGDQTELDEMRAQMPHLQVVGEFDET